MEPEPDVILDAPPNLDDVLAEARSPRTRLRRGLMTAALIGVTLVAALVASSRLGIAPPFPGSGAVVQLASNVDWATFDVTTGSRRITVPVGQRVHVPIGSSLQPNLVEITGAAIPFAAFSCQVTFPLSRVDTCPVTVTGNQQYLIGIAFTLDNLPPDQANMIQFAVQQALFAVQPQIAIPIGGHYGDGSLLSETFVTDQPILATLQNDPATPDRVPDRRCPSVCAPDLVTTPHLTSPHVWHAQIYITQTWQFVNAGDGAFVGQVQETTVPVAIPFDLTYDPARLTWTMAPPDLTFALTSSLCLDGRAYAANYFFVPSSSLTSYDPNPSLIDHGLSGCLVQYTDHQGHTLTFLWRTGLLFAADAVTHLAEPYLPIASAPDLQAYNAAG